MAAARQRRIVLFPYGQPKDAEHRDRCAEFFLSLGGDISRIIDGPFSNIDRFIGYVRRIETIAEGLERPILVLTATNPLALTVIAARRKIEQAIPFLRQGTWALFVDPIHDPFFTQSARTIGAFSYGAEGLTWLGPDGDPFLIAMPEGCVLPGVPSRSSRPASDASPKMTPPPHSMERMRTRPAPPDSLDLSRARTGTDEAPGSSPGNRRRG